MSVNLTKANSKRVSAGHDLISQGEEPLNFYILRRGKVEVLRHAEVINTVSDSDYPLGCIGVIMGQPRSATVRAKAQSVVLEIEESGDDVYEWLINEAKYLVTVLKHVSSMINSLNEENKANFEGYRDLRSYFKPFVKPANRIVSEINVDPPRPLGQLLEARNSIVGSTSKTNKAQVQIDMSDDLKHRFDRGEVICEEGDTGNELYVLLKGELQVLKESQMVARLDKPGLIFGEMATLMDGHRTATVKADTDVEIAVIPIDSLESFLSDKTRVAQKISDMMFDRFRKAQKLNHDLETFQEVILKIFQTRDLLDDLRNAVQSLVDEAEGVDPNLQDQVDALKDWLSQDIEATGDFEFTRRASNETDDKFYETIN
ncbi:MAG: cyclic nucleotide-binding domain-containing protein [bacterium]